MAKFRKKPVIVEAICITQPMLVKTPNAVAKGKAGDWLITSLAGEEYFVNDRAFHENYEPVDENSAAYLQEIKDRNKFGF